MNNVKTPDTLKIQSMIAINFISSKDSDKEDVTHSKNRQSSWSWELFQSLFSRYQVGLETSMKGSDFLFDCVHYYTTDFKRGLSYIDSADWMKNKIAAINLVRKKDFISFQYAVTVTLNHEQIKKDVQRITKIKHFTDKRMWEGTNYKSEEDDQKKIEKNIQLLLMFCLLKTRTYILFTFKSKTQSTKSKLSF